MIIDSEPVVVVAGDALIDLTPTRTVRGNLAYEPHPGGSCLNVAVGLGRLGVPTAFLARLSGDAFGEMLRAQLADAGVQPTYLVDTDDLTTLAAVHLSSGQPTYTFHARSVTAQLRVWRAMTTRRGFQLGIRSDLSDVQDHDRLAKAMGLHDETAWPT